MSKISDEDADNLPAQSLTELVAFLENQSKQIRREGHPAAIIVSAKTAADTIQQRVGATGPELSPDERDALVAAKRMMFNAAADCWPGWAVDSSRASEADLMEALELAQRSAHLVEALALGPMQEGTAAWLIGALQLALGRIDDARASLSDAGLRYHNVPAPALELLAQGYVAITFDATGETLPRGVPSLEVTIAAIAAGQFDDGEALRNQLQTAQQIFAKKL